VKALFFVCVLALAAVLTVAANVLLSRLLAGYTPDPRWVLLAIVVIPPLYFVPSIMAANKSHPHGTAIFLVNLLLGWTVVGWLACLIWEANAPGAPKTYRPLIMPRRPATPADPAPSTTAEASARALEALVAQRYSGQITEAEYLSGRQMIIDQWRQMPLVAS